MTSCAATKRQKGASGGRSATASQSTHCRRARRAASQWVRAEQLRALAPRAPGCAAHQERRVARQRERGVVERGDGAHEQLGRLHAQQEAICSGLARRGWFALDGLLDAEDAALVRSEASAMYRGGEFSTRFLRSRRRSVGERWAIQGL